MLVSVPMLDNPTYIMRHDVRYTIHSLTSRMGLVRNLRGLEAHRGGRRKGMASRLDGGRIETATKGQLGLRSEQNGIRRGTLPENSLTNT